MFCVDQSPFTRFKIATLPSRAERLADYWEPLRLPKYQPGQHILRDVSEVWCASSLGYESEVCVVLKPYVGDITHFEIFGKNIVVLNTLHAAQELLDKRSRVYSDRPPFNMGEM